MLLLALATSLAAEPVVTRGEDSWIEAHVDVAATPEATFAVVSDPAQVARIDGTVKVTTAPDGDCVAVHTDVEHPIASIAYDSRSCPDGELAVVSVLVGEGQMKSFDSRWWVEPREDGARLHYKVRTVTSMMIPQWMVDRSSAKSVAGTLSRIRDHLEAGS